MVLGMKIEKFLIQIAPPPFIVLIVNQRNRIKHIVIQLPMYF